MSKMKKVMAAAALGVAGVAAATGTATAADAHDDAPHSNAPVGALINGDVVDVNGDVLSDLCVAPWHWDGPIQVLTDNGPYQACQEGGGTQNDAPAIDLSDNHPFPLAR